MSSVYFVYFQLLPAKTHVYRPEELHLTETYVHTARWKTDKSDIPLNLRFHPYPGFLPSHTVFSNSDNKVNTFPGQMPLPP